MTLKTKKFLKMTAISILYLIGLNLIGIQIAKADYIIKSNSGTGGGYNIYNNSNYNHGYNRVIPQYKIRQAPMGINAVNIQESNGNQYQVRERPMGLDGFEIKDITVK